MAELGPLSVKHEDVLNRALPVVGRVGNRFIAGRLGSTIGAEQSWVDLVKASDAETHRRPAPDDPATVLRAPVDVTYLPGLRNEAGLTRLRPIAKGLQRIRNDAVHRRASLTDSWSREAMQQVRELGGDDADPNELARLERVLGGRHGQGSAQPVAVPAPAAEATVALAFEIVPNGPAQAVTTPLGTPRPGRPGGTLQ